MRPPGPLNIDEHGSSGSWPNPRRLTCGEFVGDRTGDRTGDNPAFQVELPRIQGSKLSDLQAQLSGNTVELVLAVT